MMNSQHGPRRLDLYESLQRLVPSHGGWRSCEIPTCKSTRKNLPIIFLDAFCFIFYECILITSSEESLKVCEHNFLQFTCNLPVQLRFLQVSFLHAEYATGRSLEYSFCQLNWNSFISCNIKITRTSFFLLCVLICAVL